MDTTVFVNGRGLKSIHQYYNRRRAALQAEAGNRSSIRLRRLTEKRNRQVRHLLHVASRMVIGCLVLGGIDTLVIRRNPNWKQQVNLGGVNNQKFVGIPHAVLLEMLRYKSELVGIKVVLQEES